MPLNIKDEVIHAKAKELARLSGKSITKAVGEAIEARLEQLRNEARRQADDGLAERLMAIGRHCASLPVLDERTPDEILGYDEHGLPT